jgi:hypothetical protein
MSETAQQLIALLNRINSLIPPQAKTGEYVRLYTRLNLYIQRSTEELATLTSRCAALEVENLRLAELVQSSNKYFVSLPETEIDANADFGPSIPASVEDLLSPKRPLKKAAKKE